MDIYNNQKLLKDIGMKEEEIKSVLEEIAEVCGI
jgi:uncharacterized protein YjiS (DUF1127 family)